MEEAKTLMKLGPFGVIALCILIFISCTCCLCFIIHVKFIWTVLCPLQSLLNCCTRFANKFRSSHKATPKTFSDLEKRTLGSKRALKIARRANQSCELKDFHHISPRINSLIVDIQQESTRKVVYKRCGDQILLPGVKSPEPKGPKIGPSFEVTGSSFEVAGTHLVELHQNPIEKPIVSTAELRKSLFLESTSRNTQTDCLLSEIQPLRERAGSVGQLSRREPFPRIRLVQEAGGTCQRY